MKKLPRRHQDDEREVDMYSEITFRQYCYALLGKENEPASMKVLLSPFSISDIPVAEDEFLLIGHVVDALGEEKLETDHVNPMMVMELALDLGLLA